MHFPLGALGVLASLALIRCSTRRIDLASVYTRRRGHRRAMMALPQTRGIFVCKSVPSDTLTTGTPTEGGFMRSGRSISMWAAAFVAIAFGAITTTARAGRLYDDDKNVASG